MYAFRWASCRPYSIHIQFFSQNQSLLFPIKNQIVIKKEWHKKKNVKDNDDDNSNNSTNSNSNNKVTHTVTAAVVATTTE